jgi:hypothetical protein
MRGTDRNVEIIAAEVLAVKTVIGQVLGRVHQLDPVLAEAIEGGLEDAAREIRALAARTRKGTGATKVVRAIETVESLQTAVLNRSHNRIEPTISLVENGRQQQISSSGQPVFEDQSLGGVDCLRLAEECFALAAMAQDPEVASELIERGHEYLRSAAR